MTTSRSTEKSGPAEYDIFSLYGQAVYLASCLERTIVEIVSGNDILRQDIIGRERYSFFLEDASGRRFQGLLDRISEKVKLSGEMETAMRDALVERNRLLHNYWWEHYRDMKTPGSRLLLADELAKLSDRFNNLKYYLEGSHA